MTGSPVSSDQNASASARSSTSMTVQRNVPIPIPRSYSHCEYPARMTAASTTTYALLGLLAVRPWTGYELTQQVRRSLRFVWPVSEGHLYREQTRLVRLGWATAQEEATGRRARKRYYITAEGQSALAAWTETEPQEPHFQVEGIVRAFHGSHARPEDLAGSLRRTAEASRAMLEEMTGYVREYVEDGGPLSMAEGTAPVGEFHGRPMFPGRLHTVALAIDATTRLLGVLEEFATQAEAEVSTWSSTEDPSLAPVTRARLEAILARGAT